MDELDEMIAQESQRQDTESGIVNTSTEGDKPAEKPNEAVANDPEKPVETAKEEEKPAEKPADDKPAESQAAPAVTNDVESVISERLGLISGGKFKTETELKTVLSSYETLMKENAELKAKNPYATPFEQKRNEMLMAGASKDALKALENINELGDLDKLDAREALISKMVLVDGIPRKVAEIKVDKQFPIDSIEDEDEKLVMESDLELAGKDSKKSIESFKVDMSKVDNTAADQNLLTEAAKTELVNNLKPHLADLTSKVSNLTTLNLNGKEGDEAIKYDVALTADDKAQLASDIQNFMVENNLPLTQENYDQAVVFAKERQIISKYQESVQKVWAKAETHFTKFFTEKYENPSGKPNGDQKPGKTDTSASELQKWENEMIGM